MVDESKCDTPGKKIGSKGEGRGLAIGKGNGPLGIPLYKKRAKERGIAESSDILQYEEW